MKASGSLLKKRELDDRSRLTIRLLLIKSCSSDIIAKKSESADFARTDNFVPKAATRNVPGYIALKVKVTEDVCVCRQTWYLYHHQVGKGASAIGVSYNLKLWPYYISE